MIALRKSEDRGHFNHGWLDTYHTFSFGEYRDPDQQGFRVLRVLNDDRVAPGMGFGMHPHRDMEIITYLLAGELEHKDSLGSGAVLHPGEVQRITAGTGILHSEFNPSNAETVHLLQIWLHPEKRGLKPSYEQKAFPAEERTGRLRLVASPDGRDGAVTVHQDVELYATLLSPGQQVALPLRPGRHAWVQVGRGKVQLAGHSLAAGDGAAVTDEPSLSITATEPAELLVFDLP